MGEFRQLYPEYLRTPETFRQPSELGLRSIKELEPASSEEVVAAFDAAKAVMLFKGGKIGSANASEMAVLRGCQEYMSHCFSMLHGRKDAKGLRACATTLNSSEDFDEIFGIISGVCGKSVETLHVEAKKNWTRSDGKLDVWLLNQAKVDLRRIIREVAE